MIEVCWLFFDISKNLAKFEKLQSDSQTTIVSFISNMLTRMLILSSNVIANNHIRGNNHLTLRVSSRRPNRLTIFAGQLVLELMRIESLLMAYTTRFMSESDVPEEYVLARTLKLKMMLFSKLYIKTNMR